MGNRPIDLISIRAAAKRCGYRHKRSILRAAAQGRITLYDVDGAWHVSSKELYSAPLLTAGMVAKKARCSKKTVQRRVKGGLITPWRSGERSRHFTPANRFTLHDVAVVRASLRGR